MHLFEVDPPTPWRAGRVGNCELFFDCADCGAQAPPIAGMLGSAPNFLGVGLLGDTEKNTLRPAMFCTPCFAARKIRANEVRLAGDVHAAIAEMRQEEKENAP